MRNPAERPTAAFTATPELTVLANTAAVQAVETPRLLAAHFWQAAEVGGLVCDGPASILVAAEADAIGIAVADPSRSAATLTIEIPYPIGEVITADQTITIETGDRPRIIVNTGGSRGATHTTCLRALET